MFHNFAAQLANKIYSEQRKNEKYLQKWGFWPFNRPHHITILFDDVKNCKFWTREKQLRKSGFRY